MMEHEQIEIGPKHDPSPQAEHVPPKPTSKPRIIPAAKGYVRRISVEQPEESDANEEPEEDGGKKKETHAEMLQRLAATRAKKTKYGGKKKKMTTGAVSNMLSLPQSHSNSY